MPSAVQTVFGITELLEHILAQLGHDYDETDPTDGRRARELIGLQRVSRRFHAVLYDSPKLRRRMFPGQLIVGPDTPLPVPCPLIGTRVANALLTQHLRSVLTGSDTVSFHAEWSKDWWHRRIQVRYTMGKRGRIEGMMRGAENDIVMGEHQAWPRAAQASREASWRKTKFALSPDENENNIRIDITIATSTLPSLLDWYFRLRGGGSWWDEILKTGRKARREYRHTETLVIEHGDDMTLGDLADYLASIRLRCNKRGYFESRQDVRMADLPPIEKSPYRWWYLLLEVYHEIVLASPRSSFAPMAFTLLVRPEAYASAPGIDIWWLRLCVILCFWIGGLDMLAVVILALIP